MQVDLSHELKKKNSNYGDCCSQLCNVYVENHAQNSATNILHGVIHGLGKII